MLPTTERLLLGPGPSPISARVLAALSTPQRSHLDPELVALLDDIRARLARVFRAPDGALTLATSGTGTSAMEAVVANLTAPGKRALAIVTGYFGDRLAQMLTRYGAEVTRLDVEWGRAVDVEAVKRALDSARFDLVAVVHAETSTGVENPVSRIAALAREHDALTMVDAVTSLGAMPLDIAAWQIDACYSCSQKGLGAPSGLSPLVFAPRALERRVPCRSFYLDVSLLEDCAHRVADRPLEQLDLLRHEHDAPTQLHHRDLDDRHAADRDGAVGGLDEPQQEPGERRLAAAGSADDADGPPTGNLDVDVVEDRLAQPPDTRHRRTRPRDTTR